MPNDPPYIAEEKQALDPLGQTLIRNGMNREWAAAVSPAEFMVLSFVYDRTIAWRKFIEFAKIQHFSEGIPGYTSGIGISDSSIKRAIKELREQGLLYQLLLPRGGLYMLRIFRLTDIRDYDDSSKLKTKWSDLRLTHSEAEIRFLKYGQTRPEQVYNRMIEHF